MAKLLEIRSLLRAYYQKFQMVVDPIVKFLAAFITFRMINTYFAYEERLMKVPVVLLLSLLCTFTPSSILVFLAMVVSVLHIFSVSPLLALVVLVFFVILYCFFLRFTPQYGYVVVAIPVLYGLNIPYAAPIIMGLLANPIAILPSVCGVIVYYLFQILKNNAGTSTVESMEDILPMYTAIFEEVLACKQIIIVSVVFSAVIVVVYIVRKLRMEYASEIAILAGAVVNIFGFLICDLRFGVSERIGSMIVGTILSVLVALVILVSKRVLDYTAIENVQFEDDDYYYYVKAVPKLEIGIPERKVKRISDMEDTEASLEDNEDDEDDYEEILDEETGEVFFRPKKGQGTGGQVIMQKGGRGMGYMRHWRQKDPQEPRNPWKQREQMDPQDKELKELEKEREAAIKYMSGEEQDEE